MRTLTPQRLSLNTLAGLARSRRSAPAAPLKLAIPPGMKTSLGCDAVGVPEVYGRRIMARLPRVGCVYADAGLWWWVVPAGSDIALEWPMPSYYSPGALLPESEKQPKLIHLPDSAVPYTPPIPLYLAMCRLTGTAPAWSRTVGAGHPQPPARDSD